MKNDIQKLDRSLYQNCGYCTNCQCLLSLGETICTECGILQNKDKRIADLEKQLYAMTELVDELIPHVTLRGQFEYELAKQSILETKS